MARQWSIICVIAILLAPLGSGFAEKATEQYIPIGRSPGLSGKHTLIAKIVQVNAATRTLELSDAVASHSVPLTSDTRIYLDKSKTGATNTLGAFSDLKVGDTVEVKFAHNARSNPAEWIKVQKTP